MRMTALAWAMFAGVAMAGQPQDKARETIHAINPKAELHAVRDAAVPGWQEVIANGSVLYVSNDGRYLMYGQLFDTHERVNLTDVTMQALRKDLIDELPTEGRLVYRPDGEVKHRLIVFTDISCGYCKKLHQDIGEFLRRGIQVEYLAYPRGGANNPAKATMDKIWCARNPEETYTRVMAGEELEPELREGCTSVVMEHYRAGERMGIEGTPAVYTLDGEQVGGYVQAERLAALLDAKAASRARSAAGTAGGR